MGNLTSKVSFVDSDYCQLIILDNELDCLEQLSSYTAESFDLDEYMAALDADDLDTANDLGVPFAASAYDLNCSMTTVHGDHLSYYQVPDMNNGPGKHLCPLVCF